MKNTTTVYLALGSNLGDKIALLEKAILLIDKNIGGVFERSSFYETEPWGFESENTFVNMVIGVQSYFSAQKVLSKCLGIENELGRFRNSNEGYSSRTMDVDILFFGNEIINEANLVLPHPNMLSRNFVMAPLAEISPDFIHPVTKKNISEHFLSCEDTALAIRLNTCQ